MRIVQNVEGSGFQGLGSRVCSCSFENEGLFSDLVDGCVAMAFIAHNAVDHGAVGRLLARVILGAGQFDLDPQSLCPFRKRKKQIYKGEAYIKVLLQNAKV